MSLISPETVSVSRIPHSSELCRRCATRHSKYIGRTSAVQQNADLERSIKQNRLACGIDTPKRKPKLFRESVRVGALQRFDLHFAEFDDTALVGHALAVLKRDAALGEFV